MTVTTRILSEQNWGKQTWRVPVLAGRAMLFLAGLGLAACAGSSGRQKVAGNSRPWNGGETTQADIAVENAGKTNLPSAELNTPVCGEALRESARTGSVVYGTSLHSGNSCVQNACFQPLTGTYIAQSGQNTVCR